MTTPQEPPADPLSRSVGAFRLDQEIGKGSFAQVYRARRKEPPRQYVAIKSVTRSKLSTKLLENLEAEISILKAMRHPCIVDLRDCLYTEEYIHLIMEYCPGGDLSSYIKYHGDVAPWNGDAATNPLAAAQRSLYPHPADGGLNDAMVRAFLAQLASALQFLRSRDIVHRDIKPQNLLLQLPDASWVEQGHPPEIPQIKVADFGFARSLPAASLAKTLCGSPLYMAPEILRYEKYDAKADLWSVGAVLYEMAVGRPPFRAANHVELLRRIEQNNDRIKFPDERSAQSLAKDAAKRRLQGEQPRPPPHTVAADIKELIRMLLKRHPVERMSFPEFFHDQVITSVPYLRRIFLQEGDPPSSEQNAEPQAPDAPEPQAHAPEPQADTVACSAPASDAAPIQEVRRPISFQLAAETKPSDVAMQRDPAMQSVSYPPSFPAVCASASQAARSQHMPETSMRSRETSAGSANEYVVVEKHETTQPPAQEQAPEPLRPQPRHVPANPSALSRAISMASMRLFGGRSATTPAAVPPVSQAAVAAASASPSPPAVPAARDAAPMSEADLLALLQSLGQKSYVLTEFADAKLGEQLPSSLRVDNASPVDGSASPQDAAAAEALALYVRALGFLQRGLEALGAFQERAGTGVSAEVRECMSGPCACPGLTPAVAQWFRTCAGECYDKAMVVRERCRTNELPDSVQHVDRQIFDKALELARAAALDELENNRSNQFGWDVSRCILAYETASSLLLGLLDPSEESLGLSVNSASIVEKFLRSIHKRLGALQCLGSAQVAAA